MGRILFFGSGALALSIAAWYHYHGVDVPEAWSPLVAFLFSLCFLGYGKMAERNGKIGSGPGKIYKRKHPRVFHIALYVNYLLTGVLFLYSVYLLF